MMPLRLRRPCGHRATWALAGAAFGPGLASCLAAGGPGSLVLVLFSLAVLTGIAKSGTC